MKKFKLSKKSYFLGLESKDQSYKDYVKCNHMIMYHFNLNYI